MSCATCDDKGFLIVDTNPGDVIVACTDCENHIPPEPWPETEPCDECGFPVNSCIGVRSGPVVCAACYEKEIAEQEWKRSHHQTLADVGMCEADFR